jgi:hypothetical protein
MKGAAVRAVIAWFGETYGGDDVWARVLDRCSPELRSILRLGDPALGVIASGWYPTPLAGELIDVLGQLAAPADAHEFVARLGAAIARDNVTGVYRALFRLVASPTLLEANAQRVWQTYFDEGTLTITTPAAGCFEGRVRGWSRHHPSVCRAMGPLLEHALRSVGYAGLVVARPHCVAQGDSRCAFDGRWVM